ncbi:MAG: SpoIIE family protein phosphatase [Clostridia bacterium]|nr:SpoIIE family protein phosphatase [Clostridia bacterium]
MKDYVKPILSTENISNSDLSAVILKNVIISVLGFVSAKASVKGIMIPFGLSFLAGMTRSFYASAATGIFIGYFFPAISGNGFRYIAALFAILAIKLISYPYKKISGNPIFLGFIAFLSSAITNTFSLSGKLSDLAMFLCESFLAGAGGYFIAVSAKAIKRKTVGLGADEMASLLISSSILLIGFDRIKIYGVSLGKILGIVLILVASKYGGTLSGAISGIGISFASALGGNYNSSFFAYSIGGLSAGVFSPLGRYAQSAAVIVSFVIDKALSGFDYSFLQSFAEAIIGCILFIIMPKSFGSYLGKFFSLCPKISENKTLKKAINIRLNMAAEALSEISETTEKVSSELSKINTPDFGHILLKIEEDTCKGCNNRAICWETRRNATVNAIMNITKSLKGVETDNDSDPIDLKGRCIRYAKLCESTIKRYTEYSSAIASESRIEEVRTVVCNQFYGISEMLYSLSKDFENEEQFNTPVALSVSSALENLEIHAEETSANTDKYGRTTVSVRIKKTPELVMNKKQIMKLCSTACELDFDIPTINESENSVYLTLTEHANFRIETGIEQISAKENIISGDAFSYFNDGKGHFIIVLSDGMGTGGRAAVDGAMASGLMAQLIKAGFSYDCSLKLLNSSMIFKSSDESLATLDIANIDLFTGEVKLYKAGAAPTIIKRNNSCGKAESNSLPIGILDNISFDTARIRLKNEDVIVLLTDGATADGTDWIKAELEAFRGGSAQNLAEHLCSCAKRRQQKETNDDVTVITAILKKAI